MSKHDSEQGLEEAFSYKGDFNTQKLREMLGLESKKGLDLNIYEKLRLAGMLARAGCLTAEDIEKLRRMNPWEDNPFKKGICARHGEWYHDLFGCMHQDHLDNHHKDVPRGDKVCRD